MRNLSSYHNNRSSHMSTFSWIIIGLIVGAGIVYYFRTSKKGPTNKYALLEAEINKLSPEHVDSLAVSDVTEYFRGFGLKQGQQVPFIYVPQRAMSASSEESMLFLGVFDNASNSIQNGRLIAARSLDDDLKSLIGTERFIALS